jgi:hypothetical protein
MQESIDGPEHPLASAHFSLVPLQPSVQLVSEQHVPGMGTQAVPVGIWHELVHAPRPGMPQEAVHDTVCPLTQGKPLSGVASQSSSAPLQVSGGGVQAEGEGIEQLLVHVPDPVDPHTVVQATVLPLTHANTSSMSVSPSSSRPLQISLVAVHAPQAQDEEHVLVPGAPVVVVQPPMLPWQQPKPLSQAPSQSSSTPLQVSAGGVQGPQAQADEQTRVPLDPHEVVHEPVLPRQHPRPSSHAPSQSSSAPLHVSAGGMQALPDGSWQRSVQVPDPVDPQEVVQPTVSPLEQT